MCARYEILPNFESHVAAVALGLAPTDDDAKRFRKFPKGEVRPTDMAPVILPSGAMAWLPWGFNVSWQRGPVINARAETLDQKPTFKPLLQQRCVVPASAYFEWRAEGEKKVKTRITLSKERGVVFAGLMDNGTFTIITCSPAKSIAHIHDRMPVLLDRDAQREWLNTARRFADVK
ncbi:MAG: SOS response-associated peptidase, partial [Rhodospirillaceae bacterium]|nr:SOS response-associated peptidase [Rhodospirillaceae bacterium]